MPKNKSPACLLMDCHSHSPVDLGVYMLILNSISHPMIFTRRNRKQISLPTIVMAQGAAISLKARLELTLSASDFHHIVSCCLLTKVGGAMN